MCIRRCNHNQNTAKNGHKISPQLVKYHLKNICSAISNVPEAVIQEFLNYSIIYDHSTKSLHIHLQNLATDLYVADSAK